MQSTLTSPGRATLGANAAPTRTVASPSRAQSLSQLDRIAAANSLSSSAGPTGVATWLGLLGGCLLVAVAAMWQDGTGSPGMSARGEAAATVAATIAAVVDPDPSRAAAQAAPPAPSLGDTTLASQVPSSAPSRAAEPAPIVELATLPAPPPPAVDEAARKARLAAVAETRRKAALAAQERAQALETQRLAQLQQQQQMQRDATALAEQAAEAARQRAAAAEQVRLAALSGAGAPRLTVRASCGSAGGFLAQQFCQARECSKAEHQGDAVCARLRESEAERLRASIDR
jgi:hypothetical protein